MRLNKPNIDKMNSDAAKQFQDAMEGGDVLKRKRIATIEEQSPSDQEALTLAASTRKKFKKLIHKCLMRVVSVIIIFVFLCQSSLGHFTSMKRCPQPHGKKTNMMVKPKTNSYAL